MEKYSLDIVADEKVSKTPWIKVNRDSFATDEDWETVCEEVGANPNTTLSIKFYIEKADIEEGEDN